MTINERVRENQKLVELVQLRICWFSCREVRWKKKTKLKNQFCCVYYFVLMTKFMDFVIYHYIWNWKIVLHQFFKWEKSAYLLWKSWLLCIWVKTQTTGCSFDMTSRFKEGRESVRDDDSCGRSKEVNTPELIGQRVTVRVTMLRFWGSSGRDS